MRLAGGIYSQRDRPKTLTPAQAQSLETISGEAQVIIETRSAIFAPLTNLGIIILDEEHDPSFQQTQKLPTYHARTVAQ